MNGWKTLIKELLIGALGVAGLFGVDTHGINPEELAGAILILASAAGIFIRHNTDGPPGWKKPK